ncbi:MAG: hypothetical protein K0R50_3599 [Eubacterium sp.]|nr:hypothetical protein [Eubacterium sp.]
MKFFKKSDLILVLAILIIGILSMFIYKYNFEHKPAKAEIYYKTQLIKTVELNKGIDKEFSIPQNENVVFHLEKDGSISFEHSDCPDKVCIKTGKLHSVGQSAACLPNEIFLKIVPQDSRNEDDVDMVAGP